MTLLGGLTVDRWIHNLDLNLALVLTSYTAMSVGSGYALSIESLFITLFLQGALETWIAIGMRKNLVIVNHLLVHNVQTVTTKIYCNLYNCFFLLVGSASFWLNYLGTWHRC